MILLSYNENFKKVARIILVSELLKVNDENKILGKMWASCGIAKKQSSFGRTARKID